MTSLADKLKAIEPKRATNDYMDDLCEMESFEKMRDIAVILSEACQRFAKIEADDGDDFSGVHEDVILRVECTAGDIHCVRDAIARCEALLKGSGE